MNMQSQRLKRIRTEAKLSQREIGEFLGVPATTWNNYENNKSKLDITLADKICTKFNVNLEWLLFGRGEIRISQEEADRSKNLTSCERCIKLENKLDALDKERAELSAENRQLWKENAALREELAKMKAEIAVLQQRLSLSTDTSGGNAHTKTA